MSEAKHTPGPWRWVPYDPATEEMPEVRGAGGKHVMSFGNDMQYYPTEGAPPSDADRDRLLACVNACEGVSTEELASGIINEMAGLLVLAAAGLDVTPGVRRLLVRPGKGAP